MWLGCFEQLSYSMHPVRHRVRNFLSVSSGIRRDRVLSEDTESFH